MPSSLCCIVLMQSIGCMATSPTMVGNPPASASFHNASDSDFCSCLVGCATGLTTGSVVGFPFRGVVATNAGCAPWQQVKSKKIICIGLGIITWHVLEFPGGEEEERSMF